MTIAPNAAIHDGNRSDRSRGLLTDGIPKKVVFLAIVEIVIDPKIDSTHARVNLPACGDGGGGGDYVVGEIAEILDSRQVRSR